MGFFAKFRRNSAKQKHDDDPASRGQLPLAEARLKQHAAVQKMRRGVADVSVSRQRLDLQAADLQKTVDSLEKLALRQRSAGESAAAESTMNRHLIMSEQLADLLSQRDALAEQETMLISALTQLQARVAGFNVTVESITATRTAADANQAIAQALSEFEDQDRSP